MVTIDYSEIERLDDTIFNLRNQVGQLQNEVSKLNKEISLLKDSGENILVIVKDRDKPDVHEYRTNEKNVLVDLVSENGKIRERYDDVSRQKDNVENQKQMILLKYKEMETIYKNQIVKLEDYVDYLENRSILSRLKNDKKFIVHASTQAQKATDYILNIRNIDRELDFSDALKSSEMGSQA